MTCDGGDNEIKESKAFSIKVVVVAAAGMPALLMILHFVAACMHVDFTAVKEVELLLACVGILSLVAAWAFKKS